MALLSIASCLRGEEFGEEDENLRACHVIDLSHTLDQPAFVHSPDLIQHNLTRLAFKPHRYAGGVGAAFRCHGGDDHRIDVLVHFVRGDDEARADFADFTALGGIEADEKDVEAGYYHVHSLWSQVVGAADS